MATADSDRVTSMPLRLWELLLREEGRGLVGSGSWGLSVGGGILVGLFWAGGGLGWLLGFVRGGWFVGNGLGCCTAVWVVVFWGSDDDAFETEKT